MVFRLLFPITLGCRYIGNSSEVVQIPHESQGCHFPFLHFPQHYFTKTSRENRYENHVFQFKFPNFSRSNFDTCFWMKNNNFWEQFWHPERPRDTLFGSKGGEGHWRFAALFQNVFGGPPLSAQRRPKDPPRPPQGHPRDPKRRPRDPKRRIRDPFSS